MEAKRMRLQENPKHEAKKLELQIYKLQCISQALDDNYINRLLESTRLFLETTEELTVENEAISTAISTFGLKNQQLDSSSDFQDLPSTSSSSSQPSASSSSSTFNDTSLILESEAINSAISSYGLQTDQLKFEIRN